MLFDLSKSLLHLLAMHLACQHRFGISNFSAADSADSAAASSADSAADCAADSGADFKPHFFYNPTYF